MQIVHAIRMQPVRILMGASCALVPITLMVMASTALDCVSLDFNCPLEMRWNVVSILVDSGLLVISKILFSECSNGDLRLVGGSASTEGILEICLNNSYGAICDDFWDVQDARVACFRLGFTNGSFFLFSSLCIPQTHTVINS